MRTDLTFTGDSAAELTDARTHKEVFYPESAFGGFTDIDGTIAFYTRVNALLQSTYPVIDVGCGRGSHAEDPLPWRRNLRSLKGKASQVIGLDVDEETARGNPSLDEFRPLLANGGWPVKDKSIGLVLSDCVLEHLSDPGSFFSEAGRVLQPGGTYVSELPTV